MHSCPSATAPGYSGTPLVKKLGIGARSRVLLRGAPAGYRDWLAPMPEHVAFASRLSATVDVVHLFVTDRAALASELARMRSAIRPDAALWVSWPKRSAKVLTDITEDSIREVALPLGFVDVKVCAVSELWSGLKLVIRKALR